jgi:putative ABC transport system substrate-binding protein
MDRRTFISLVAGGCLALASVGRAQQTGKVYRIGVLGAGTAAVYAHRMELFRQALQELGWVNERNVTFDERWADGRYERLPGFATELLGLRVDLILAVGGTPAVEAAMKATRAIPIVFTTVGDPVAQKLVQSVAHPGGNATGLANMATELYSKRLELLREAEPGIKHVALLMNSANSYAAVALLTSHTTSRSLGIQLQAFDARTPEEFDQAFVSMSESGVQGVVVAQDDTLQGNMKQLGGLALKHHLPLVAAGAENGTEIGVLVAYDRNVDANYHRAAAYVDKILKGADPGDLPIEQPTKFFLIVNLKTAKALGITIPQSLLLRADEVIE